MPNIDTIISFSSVMAALIAAISGMITLIFAILRINEHEVHTMELPVMEIRAFLSLNPAVIFNGEIYSIKKESYMIGRKRDCDMVITDESVSSRHCKIYYDSGKFMLVDMRSKNGIYVNGKKISEATVLHNQDKIQIGRVTLEFSISENANTNSNTNNNNEVN